MKNSSANLLAESTIEQAEQFRQINDSAVLTVAFTDIAKSTELRETLGERTYEKYRTEHEAEISEIVSESNAGQVVKGTGDGALIVFEKPSVAVERLLDIQDAVAAHPHFQLRIGIDVGEVTRSGRGRVVSDVFGRHVNRAARIQALAHPGHVLTSELVWDMSVGWLIDSGISWQPHGKCFLKGLGRHHIYEPFRDGGTAQGSIDRGTADVVVLNQEAVSMSGQGVKGLSRSSENDGNTSASAQTLRPDRPKIRRTSLPASALIDGNGINFFAARIGVAARQFMQRYSSPPKLLWVDDHPENNAQVAHVLERSMCEIHGARSTAEGLEKFRKNRYEAVVTDMGRDNRPSAGVELLLSLAKLPRYVPSIVFTSPDAVVRYGREARKVGAVACTAGFITLLDSLQQVIRWWVTRPETNL